MTHALVGFITEMGGELKLNEVLTYFATSSLSCYRHVKLTAVVSIADI